MPFTALLDAFCLAPHDPGATLNQDTLHSKLGHAPVQDVNSALPLVHGWHEVSRSRSVGSSFLSDVGKSFLEPEPRLESVSCPLPTSASYHTKMRDANWVDTHVTAFLKVPGNTTLLGFSMAGAQAGAKLLKAKSAATQAETHAAHADVHVSSHEDFIFGGSKKKSHLSADAFNSLTPAYSMLGSWPGALKMSLEQAEEEYEDAEPTGWTKMVPRALMVFTVWDMVNCLVAYFTRRYVCDVPLRLWLVVSVFFGLPADGLIKLYGWFQKPRYKIYRITVNRCRDDTILPEEFAMESPMFFGEYRGKEDFNFTEGRTPEVERQGNVFTYTFDVPLIVNAYQFISSQTEPPGKDPVDWILECSNTGVAWELADQVEGAPIPRQRNKGTQIFDALLSVEENAAFRQAFVLEVLFSAGSFAWLVTGTSWVAKASETCVDSAPPLWLYSYCLVVLAWSLMGTITTGLIVSAVAMVLLGVKSQ